MKNYTELLKGFKKNIESAGTQVRLHPATGKTPRL